MADQLGQEADELGQVADELGQVADLLGQVADQLALWQSNQADGRQARLEDDLPSFINIPNSPPPGPTPGRTNKQDDVCGNSLP